MLKLFLAIFIYVICFKINYINCQGIPFYSCSWNPTEKDCLEMCCTWNYNTTKCVNISENFPEGTEYRESDDCQDPSTSFIIVISNVGIGIFLFVCLFCFCYIKNHKFTSKRNLYNEI